MVDMRSASQHIARLGLNTPLPPSAVAAVAILLVVGFGAWVSLQSDRYVMRGEGTLTVILDTVTGEVRNCYSDRSGGACHLMQPVR